MRRQVKLQLILPMALVTIVASFLIYAGVASAFPNSFVNITSPPGIDQNNAEVSASEANPGEFYAVWTEFLTPSPIGSRIGWAFSIDGGVTWNPAVKPVPPGFTDEWNAAISAHSPATVGGYMITNTAFAGPPWMGPNSIEMNTSPGGGAGFGPSVTVAMNAFPTNWLDYSNVVLDDYMTNPPPAFGTGHMAWGEYLDLTGGDADGNGNAFDDIGDIYNIWYS